MLSGQRTSPYISAADFTWLMVCGGFRCFIQGSFLAPGMLGSIGGAGGVCTSAAAPLAQGVVARDKLTNLLSEYRTYLDAVVLAGAAAAQ